uniref:Programmed cell death 1 ligand 2 n=1 Tax=Meleagris gallopavo TaxID=9103 RepID=A0A803Y7Q8_MELGA
QKKKLLVLSLSFRFLFQHSKQQLFSFSTLALFTVEVPQQLYVEEYGSNVTMECRFPVNGSLNLGLLTLLSSQHHDYMGRAALLHNELKSGRAILQITSIKITDAGSYLCLIDYQGADYKYITLEVKASYKIINTQKTRKWNGDKFAFICHLSGSANTTYTLTADGLYNVTSILIINQNMNENYSCIFWNKELNENTSAYIYSLGSLLVLLPALIIFQKRKLFKNFRAKKGTFYFR